MKVKILIVCILILIDLGFCQQFEGDTCTLERTGETGICLKLEKCQTAIHDFHAHGIFPQNCGFQGHMPIVCCVGCKSDGKPTSEYLAKLVINVNQGDANVGKKSQEKCQEYGRQTFVDSSLNMLPDLQYTATCPFPSVELAPRFIAKSREFPHMAAIGYSNSQNGKMWGCSGSLISELFVLTSASCVHHSLYGTSKYVRLGDLILNDEADDANPQEFNIQEEIVHPNFRQSSKYNDIALVKLDRPAQYNSYVKPACLNTNPTVATTLAIVSGWRYTSELEKRLIMAKLKYSAYSECNSSHTGDVRLSNGIIEKLQICADAEDACQDDLGGPLQVYNNLEAECTYKIIGVTTISKSCGERATPGVYTRVSRYIGWIESVVWS